MLGLRVGSQDRQWEILKSGIASIASRHISSIDIQNEAIAMLKSASWIVALLLTAAPILPARADIIFRSTPSGSSVRVNSGSPYRSGIRHYPNQVIIRQDGYNSSYPGVVRPYDSYNNRVLIQRSNYYNPYFPRTPYNHRPRTVIVVPRTVIVNPGYSNSIRNCGNTIYGSSIASPIPVNPYTGLACR